MIIKVNSKVANVKIVTFDDNKKICDENVYVTVKPKTKDVVKYVRNEIGENVIIKELTIENRVSVCDVPEDVILKYEVNKNVTEGVAYIV